MRRGRTHTSPALIDLPDLVILGAEPVGLKLEVRVETSSSRSGFPVCGVRTHVTDGSVVAFVNLPVDGRLTTLCWHKRR